MQSIRIAPLLLVVLLLAACGPSRPAPRSGPGAPAPAAAVERFMRLVQEKDYPQMGWVFGTVQGPIIQRDPPRQVERRMYALASVLRHERFSISREEPVPGRTGVAVRLSVRTVQSGKTHEVPFVTVRGPEGQWFVEEVGLEAITSRRR